MTVSNTRIIHSFFQKTEDLRFAINTPNLVLGALGALCQTVTSFVPTLSFNGVAGHSRSQPLIRGHGDTRYDIRHTRYLTLDTLRGGYEVRRSVHSLLD